MVLANILLGKCFWFICAIANNDIRQMILWVVFTIFNIYGWIEWNKEAKKKKLNPKLKKMVDNYAETNLH